MDKDDPSTKQSRLTKSISTLTFRWSRNKTTRDNSSRRSSLPNTLKDDQIGIAGDSSTTASSSRSSTTASNSATSSPLLSRRDSQEPTRPSTPSPINDKNSTRLKDEYDVFPKITETANEVQRKIGELLLDQAKHFVSMPPTTSDIFKAQLASFLQQLIDTNSHHHLIQFINRLKNNLKEPASIEKLIGELTKETGPAGFSSIKLQLENFLPDLPTFVLLEERLSKWSEYDQTLRIDAFQRSLKFFVKRCPNDLVTNINYIYSDQFRDRWPKLTFDLISSSGRVKPCEINCDDEEKIASFINTICENVLLLARGINKPEDIEKLIATPKQAIEKKHKGTMRGLFGM